MGLDPTRLRHTTPSTGKAAFDGLRNSIAKAEPNPKGVYNDMADFADWYAQYPKRVARAVAERAWLKMTERDREAAFEALPTHVRFWNASGTAKEYIPYPATWLNGRRWEDELEMPEIAAKLVAWWSTDAGILAKGREVGCSPRPGEDMATYKSRVAEAIRRAA